MVLISFSIENFFNMLTNAYLTPQYYIQYANLPRLCTALFTDLTPDLFALRFWEVNV